MKVNKKPEKSPATKTKAVNKSDMKTGNASAKVKNVSKDDRSGAGKKETNVGSASVHSPPRTSRTGAKSKSVGTCQSAKIHGSKVLSKKVIPGISKDVKSDVNKSDKSKKVSVKSDNEKRKKVPILDLYEFNFIFLYYKYAMMSAQIKKENHNKNCDLT